MLTNIIIQDATPFDRPRKLADSGGLYLLLNPNASRYWRLDYRFAGKRKTLSMGTFPDTDLESARRKRDEARKQLAAGIDPGEQRKRQKPANAERLVAEQAAIERDLQALSNTARHSVTDPRPLSALGIDPMEERAYRVLLTHRMATMENVAHMLALSPRRAQQLLDRIEMKGLVTHTPERPRRYIAASPKLAVEAIASQRQADIERARAAIPELMEQVADDVENHGGERVVEVINSRAALSQILVQLRQTIQTEAFGFQCAPVVYSRVINKQEMRPGVRLRSISDASYLGLPGVLESVRLDVKNGEEARFFSTLPAKMFVVDRRIALIPLNSQDPGGASLLVRASSLLDTLCAYFELIWERATPFVFTRTGGLEVGAPASPLSDAAEHAMSLLAAGLNDKAIAHEAGISIATLNRRVAELMKSFGTRTRFQLGWRAALDAFPERLNTDSRKR